MYTVCRGTTSGITHNQKREATYRQYLDTYSNCTYIDGNVEIVFLRNQTNYDLSFLKVLRVELLLCSSRDCTRLDRVGILN